MIAQGCVYDTATGETLQRRRAPSADAIMAGPFTDGTAAIAYTGSGDVEDIETYLAGAVIGFRARTYDPAVLLAAAKTVRWSEAKEICRRRMVAGCNTTLGRVQTDEASQTWIDKYATMAAIKIAAGQPFPITFIMADNSAQDMTAEQLVDLGYEVSSYLAACKSASVALRALINAATTTDAVAAIDITAGYPA
jgi:hypothetical protein